MNCDHNYDENYNENYDENYYVNYYENYDENSQNSITLNNCSSRSKSASILVDRLRKKKWTCKTQYTQVSRHS